MTSRHASSARAYGERLALWLATGVGVGLVVPAPGTLGGLWGIPLAAAVHQAPGPWGQLAVITVLLAVAAGVCGLAAKALDAVSDPQAIVLDEIVVLPVVFVGVADLNWRVLAVGFMLFRLFDIWKPGLVGAAERIRGGLGIVADDAAAAALAWAALRAILWCDGRFEWALLGVA